MIGAFLILAAIMLAGVVLALGIYYLQRDALRTRQEQAARFRDALMLQLRKKGLSSLDIDRLVEENGVPIEVARQVTEGVYANYCRQALADAQVTEPERRGLNALRLSLAISTDVAEGIETRARDERYRVAAVNAMVDGKLTDDEVAELVRLRSRLGLSAEYAARVVETSAHDGYLALFRRVIGDGRITAEEMRELQRYRSAFGISRNSSNDIVREEVLSLYRQWFTSIVQDGQVTLEEEQGLAWLRNEFGLDSLDTSAYDSQLQDVKRQAAYREGNLPSVRTNKLLQGGEICHWESRCCFEWQTATMAKEADGELVVTSEQLVFSSPLRSFSVAPSKVVDIIVHGDALVIRTSSSRGNGTYRVREPKELEAILVGLTRRHKYQLSANYSSSLSRHIPDSVRREVWHRDGGRCVRCGTEDYLEFDHVIPHARGGANTIANVQVLCRKCNGLKSDRI